MKKLTCCIALGVLTIRAILAQATNEVHFVPTNNVIAAHGPYQGDNIFRIAPNTLAFEKYGLNFMLSEANKTREEWHLDIPNPLTIHDVLFWVKATPWGIQGSIGTRDNRFHWGFDHNNLTHFDDNKYWPRSFRYHWDEEARLAKIKSRITSKEAGEIARKKLHKLGFREEQFHLQDKVDVNQYKFEETNGIIYPLPCFNVVWPPLGKPEYLQGSNTRDASVFMEISGITKNVVEYFNAKWFSRTLQLPRTPIATNYFQMLNLPTNYLDTLPASKRFMLGLPPLTNSSPQTTDLMK